MHSNTNVISLRTSGDSGTNSPPAHARQEAARQEDARQEEKRVEPRRVSGERLFVQITQASDQGLIGVTLSCKCVDVSAHGIKFLSESFIPVGCLLDLWVDDKSRPGKFFLSGETRWTHKAGSEETLVGVRLHDGLATDIENWMEVHRN